MKVAYNTHQSDDILLNAKQLLMEAISDSRRAIAQRSMIESGVYEKRIDNTGDRYIIDSIRSLYILLFDYGDATIRSDVDDYYKKNYIKKIEVLNKKKEKDWYAKADESIKLFDFIMKTLNKYGILIADQPEGFSNVIIECLPEDG